MRWLREKVESIVFAGLKPGSHPRQGSAALPDTRIGRLRRRIDGWVSGGPAPSDPLYLSRRTTAQKIRAWLVVAVPLIVLLAGIGLVLDPYLGSPQVKPKELAPAEVAAKMLPNLGNIKIESNPAIDVIEVRVQQSGGPRINGVLKNKTDRAIAAVELTCDVTDAAGTQLGSVILHVDHIPASSTKNFSLPVKLPTAAFVLVREIATR